MHKSKKMHTDLSYKRFSKNLGYNYPKKWHATVPKNELKSKSNIRWTPERYLNASNDFVVGPKTKKTSPKFAQNFNSCLEKGDLILSCYLSIRGLAASHFVLHSE